MTNKLILAAAQLTAGPTSLQDGLLRHIKFINQARELDTDILVFPELSLTGYSFTQPIPEIALRINDDLVFEIADKAVGITVTFGFVEEGDGALFYNSAMTVRDGKILNVHRKINLATYGLLEEGKHFTAGEEVNSFVPADEKDPWCAGALICADHWNPLLLSLSALRGSNILIAPIASASEAVGGNFSNPKGWEQNLGNTALTFGSYILMSNWIGPQNGMNYWGGSSIVSPQGIAISQAEEGECLISAEADYAQVKNARYLLPTLRDLNPHHFVREFTRIRKQ
ncbi:nitrilase-related carbon-nitrogen hydrolase [Kiloniella majae]|uniref:nitrilase-related carbon-nitrogen hydrolase n=1 Tax=Kiloniella majae TaxID=1938558 RepID=UPI000A27898D|nr:nitrilase-related carbon-nitrogen hydrolase [Kiloniella majae]